MSSSYIDVLENVRTRWCLYCFFGVLAVLNDMITLRLASADHTQVPGWLRFFNFLWVTFNVALGIFALLVIQRPDWVQKVLRINDHVMSLLNDHQYRRIRVVFFALWQPFNCLWFYRWAGFPGLMDGKCSYYQEFEGVLKVSAPGETYPPKEWFVANATEIPAQPGCESAVSAAFDNFFGLSGDRWDEIYEFGLRVFGFCAGAIIDRQATITGKKGLHMDFTAGLSDIFDLFIMSFENVKLMKEGKRAMWVGDFKLIGTSFDFVVSIILVLAYLFAVIRIARLLKLGDALGVPAWVRCPIDIGGTVDLFLALAQEVIFLLVRLTAWLLYEIPISVLMIKNVVFIFIVIQDFCTAVQKDAQNVNKQADKLAENVRRKSQDSARSVDTWAVKVLPVAPTASA